MHFDSNRTPLACDLKKGKVKKCLGYLEYLRKENGERQC